MILATNVLSAMQKPELPLKQPASQNSLLAANDENLSHILLSGSKDELRKMLDNRLVLPTRIFFNKLFKDKSLLQATLELQTNSIYTTGKEGRYEIAQLLIDKGADKRDLNEFLIPAVKAVDEKLVQFLIANGVKDQDGKAYTLATELENSATTPAIKKQKFARIKELLPNRKSLLTPIKKPSIGAAVLVDPAVTQREKPLPPVPVKNAPAGKSKPVPYKSPAIAESMEAIENIYGNRNKK